VIGDKGNDVISLVLSPHSDLIKSILRLVTIDVQAVRKTLRDAGYQVAELEDYLD
jgi:hypothetical protein